MTCNFRPIFHQRRTFFQPEVTQSEDFRELLGRASDDNGVKPEQQPAQSRHQDATD